VLRWTQDALRNPTNPKFNLRIRKAFCLSRKHFERSKWCEQDETAIFQRDRESSRSRYPDYAHIVDLLPDDGLMLKHLANNLNTTRKVVLSIPKDRLLHRYAEGKWTIKEILGYIVDDERIYVYRALRFARNDSTERSGFDQDQYAQYSEANKRAARDLLDSGAPSKMRPRE
jgi:hypothetical protein